MRTNLAQRPDESASRRAAPQSIGRILLILERLVAARAGGTQSVSLSDMADATGTPKSSLLGLLQGLRQEGCVVRDADGAYALGDRFLRLATNAVFSEQMVGILRPVLTELVAATGETAVLGALSADQRMITYLDRVESPNPIRYAVETGVQRELHCTAGGKLLLAFMSPARLETVLDGIECQKFTPSTITDKHALRAELGRIRADHLSRTADERVSGASGLAVPVFGPNGTVAATVLIAGPSERMRRAAVDNEAAIQRAAARCQSFGFLPAPDATNETEH
ncbi:MAG: IclR family transcriptional regulator [Minwuia sp.]|nr:IclR family transcriptional regulator [Minwuia sp.]